MACQMQSIEAHAIENATKPESAGLGELIHATDV
jgi:hypothetical protein